MAFPHRNWGKLFPKCASKLDGDYPTGWSMPLQFCAATRDGSGVYMAAHDPAAWKKSFTLKPGKLFAVRTYAENMGVPGSGFAAPFPVVIGVFRGGWMEAAKIYRSFALTAPWTSEGRLSQRRSTPQAAKDVGLWFQVGSTIGPETGSLAEKNRPLVAAQEYFGVPLAAHWYNWHQIPFDTHYPHYFPAKPGVPEQVRDLVGRGMVIMPYINGRIVDKASADFADFCFDPTHGHPLGGGGWWVDGYRKMLRQIQRAAHRDGRDMTITSECVAEPFMDGIDAFLVWQPRDQQDIPLMTAVYSGYSLYFASPESLKTSNRGWFMIQGRDFLWGCQNGWMGSELLTPEHAGKAAFFRQIGQCRVAGREFLTYGELVGFINHPETVTEPWATGPATLPIAQGSIWRAEDGALGVFLVNYLERDVTLTFTFDPAQYGLAPGHDGYRVRCVMPGGTPAAAAAAGPLTRTETLAPAQIRFLEIRAAAGPPAPGVR